MKMTRKSVDESWIIVTVTNLRERKLLMIVFCLDKKTLVIVVHSHQ